jgi:DNA helicase-2/ATP-dependent DNA helicase PcrA
MQEFTDRPEREDASVSSFLQDVSLLTDMDDWEEEAARVTLMTLHTAKGLEFPFVFITGLEEGLFPNARSADEPGGLEEERRLFYVGVTRARERVAILHAGSRRRWDSVGMTVPSRFLAEIDEEHVERRSLGRATAPRPGGYGSGGFGSGGRGGGWSGGRDGYGGAGRGTGARQVPVDSWKPRRPAAEDVPDFVPSYEDENQDIAQIRPGMRVMHPSWGEGIVEDVEGTGERTKLTIQFRGGVLKKVLAVYAKLELLG